MKSKSSSRFAVTAALLLGSVLAVTSCAKDELPVPQTANGNTGNQSQVIATQGQGSSPNLASANYPWAQVAVGKVPFGIPVFKCSNGIQLYFKAEIVDGPKASLRAELWVDSAYMANQIWRGYSDGMHSASNSWIWVWSRCYHIKLLAFSIDQDPVSNPSVASDNYFNATHAVWPMDLPQPSSLVKMKMQIKGQLTYVTLLLTYGML